MDAAPRPSGGDRRIALLVGCTSFVFFLLLQHGHFTGSDEVAVYEMARSLYERGDLAVPPLRHTEVGADGRRYSYFAPGQAVLVLPLLAAATPLRAVLPEAWSTAIAGPPHQRGAHRFGGELEAALVGLYAPLSAACLVALFYRFERELGVSPRTGAGLSLLVAASTHTAVMSTYFLQHTTETLLLLGSLLLFRRFGATGRAATLAAASAAGSAIFLVRVPAAIAGPALAAYLAWLLYRRREWRSGPARVAILLGAIALPLALAIAVHLVVNDLRWGSLLASPMTDQRARFNHPLGRGLAGLLLSPGSSVFLYSPLLLAALPAFATLWRKDRALAGAVLAIVLTWLPFYARFDGWSGLWSAPGPRYLFPLVPLLLLAVGPWLDGAQRASRRWAPVFALALVGAAVQAVSIVVRWGSVPNLAAYPLLDPDQADFLFEWSRSPVVVMAGLLASGGPIDSWLFSLWQGWEGFPGRPGAVLALVAVLGGALGACGLGLQRALRGAG